MEASEWIATIKLFGAAMGAILLGLGGYFSGRKGKASARLPGDGDVVAATFTERAVLERLIGALANCTGAIERSNTITAELVELMQDEARRRHDEVVIRQELRRRGIPD